jgi:glucose-6-phosphate isomerase
MIDTSLIQIDEGLKSALQQLEAQSVLPRIWEHDHAVWDPDPDEITNRLGWLDIPILMVQALAKPLALRDSLREQGMQKIVLLGMGGSSLAPDVFRRTFGSAAGYPELVVLDSTHPDTVQQLSESLNWEKTAFIVATKSGTTVETLSMFRYFYNWVLQAVGERSAGDHFIAITDPESPLVELANEYSFREIFINDPNIGGRYSALSYFGLVPATLIGVDVERLLEHAVGMRRASLPEVELIENESAVLGTVLGTLANLGRDKLTIVCSDEIEPFGDWIEQLIAESTGKNGKGILPVIGEQVGGPEVYGSDRVFVHMCYGDDSAQIKAMRALADAGHPVVTVRVEEMTAFGGLFFIWEMATAIAGYWLGINPFDQPNVESAKARAKEMIAAYQEKGGLPAEKPALDSESAALFVGAPEGKAGKDHPMADSIEASLNLFLQTGDQDAYVTIQAYLDPSLESTEQLRLLQSGIRDATGMATTLGYGPRYLHSTGQLHKGDAGKGLFIQLTDEKKTYVEIPEMAGSNASAISFNTLIDAQALGDRQALVDADRSVVRMHFKGDVVATLRDLTHAIL